MWSQLYGVKNMHVLKLIHWCLCRAKRVVHASNNGFIQTPLRCLWPKDLTAIKPFFYSTSFHSCLHAVRATPQTCMGRFSPERTLLNKGAKWNNLTKFHFPWMARDDQWVVLLFDSFVLFHFQVSKATSGPNAWEGHSLHPHCLSPYLHATFLPSWMCIDRIMVSPPCIS